MAHYLERLKTLTQSPQDQLPTAPLSSSIPVERAESIVPFVAADSTAKTDKTAESSPIKGFVNFDSSFKTGSGHFSRRVCGTCRHALRDPESHPVSSWCFCGLGWIGGFADHWHCDHRQDAACASPHDAQVERAKTLIALGWSPSNAIAKARGESTQRGQS